jgi:hypothetical protein
MSMFAQSKQPANVQLPVHHNVPVESLFSSEQSSESAESLPPANIHRHNFDNIPVYASTNQPARDKSSFNTNQPGQSLPFLDTIQSSFGSYDISHIRAHTDKGSVARAWSMGAEAFASGADVTFLRTPDLYTVAHEAAHVIQQDNGVEIAGYTGQEGDVYERHADMVAERVVHGQSSEDLLNAQPGGVNYQHRNIQTSGQVPNITPSHRPIIQMRRIPPNIQDLLTSASGGKGSNFDADAEGTLVLIDRAMAELSHADRVAVLQKSRHPLTQAQFDALPRRERRIRTVDAILALFPNAQLGDMSLIKSGARPGTTDAVNITALVGFANTIFIDIASGARDTWLTEIFGAANIAAAKTKYANARTRMNTLHTTDKILSDRSGFAKETLMGGLSGPSAIKVTASVIDTPFAIESWLILIHESMHAGNSDVGDLGYINTTGFVSMADADKLKNAAHFEVVPRRILGAVNAYTGITFVPAGTTVGGVAAPPDPVPIKGAKDASDNLENAWALGLNLHEQYVHLFRTPTDWTVPQPTLGGIRFDNSIPFWSKVQKLTVHLKTIINPASAEEEEHPMSQIDLALSEGLTRKLRFANLLLSPLDTEAKVLAFENSKATAAELSAVFPGGAHSNAAVERDFLLKLAVRDTSIAPMTGRVSRDLRVVTQMNLSSNLWSDILMPRNPASFAD